MYNPLYIGFVLKHKQTNNTMDYKNVMNGEVSAIDAYIDLYKEKALIEKQLADIKELAVLEREKYGKERILRRGYEVEVNKGRSIWNYKDVSIWNDTKERLKEIENMAQMASKNTEVIDKETGEVVEPASVTFTADGIKLTYKGE